MGDGGNGIEGRAHEVSIDLSDYPVIPLPLYPVS